MWKFQQKNREDVKRRPAVERRAHQRISLLLTVNCRTPGERESILLLTQNISVRGMRFVTEQAVEQGQVLELQLLLSSSMPPVKARGHVVWCTEKQSGGKTYTSGGIFFTCIDEEHARLLQSYIDRLALTGVEAPLR